MNKIYYGDNLPILKELASNSINLIYIDPPFNTGKIQTSDRIKTIKTENGDRVGFQGNSYKTIKLGTKSYSDKIGDEYIIKFIKPRLIEAKRILTSNGSLYFHIDYREVHYCKILLDEIFGRDHFINEIIWSYDFGGKAKSRWPTKHDNILFYVKNPKDYIFNTNLIDRIPYMAPGLVGKEKANKKKLPTDTWWDPFVGKRNTDIWWNTIVGTNSKKRTGYPNQKPRGVIDRIIKASSLPDDIVLDFFAGSGTTGESCYELKRKFILIDNNIEALEVMAKRFIGYKNTIWINFDPAPYQKNINEKQSHLPKYALHKMGSEFKFLLSSSSYLQRDLENKNDIWKNSPFEWVLQLSAAQKGKLGRHLIKTWFESQGFHFRKSVNKNTFYEVNGHPISTKFSTIWTGGSYKFQQIRDHGYEFLICFGLSPYTVHCWVFKKDYIVHFATPQHKGNKGAEYWIAINPLNQPRWSSNCGGTLKKASNKFKEILNSTNS